MKNTAEKLLEFIMVKTQSSPIYLDSSQATGNLRWIWLSWIIFMMDQAGKWLAIRFLYFSVPVKVNPFLNWILSYNRGAAYSFLGDAGGWQRWLFSGFALIASVIIIIWMHKLPRSSNWSAAGLALILGGALGNCWDRLFHGYVIDYINLHINNWNMFGIFNFADMAVTFGAVILVFTLYIAPFTCKSAKH